MSVRLAAQVLYPYCGRQDPARLHELTKSRLLCFGLYFPVRCG